MWCVYPLQAWKYFCGHFTFDHLQDSKSLNRPLDFLTVKSLTVETMVFRREHVHRKSWWRGHFERSPKKEIEETFGENLFTWHWWNSKKCPALEVFVLQKFLAAGNRARNNLPRFFGQGDSFWISSCLISMLNFCIYVFLFPFPTGNRSFQVEPDKAAPEMNKIYRSFSTGWIREVHLTYKVWVRRTEPLKTVPYDYLALGGDEIPDKLWLLFKADYLLSLWESSQ